MKDLIDVSTFFILIVSKSYGYMIWLIYRIISQDHAAHGAMLAFRYN